MCLYIRDETVSMLGNIHGKMSWFLLIQCSITAHSAFVKCPTSQSGYSNNKLKFLFKISDQNYMYSCKYFTPYN